jgi:hypothetical protein
MMDTRLRRNVDRLFVVLLILSLTACATVPVSPEMAAARAACKTEEHP